MELTVEEKQVEGNRVCDEMATYTTPALAAIYGVISEQRGELVGSGTFVRLHGNPYLLTAAHVILENTRYDFLAHTTSYGAKPAPIIHPFQVIPPPIDLAIARVEENVVTGHRITPWNVDAMDTNSSGIERDILFVHGYPGDKSKWVPIVRGGVHSTSLPFWTSDGDSDWGQFDSTKHAAIMYPKGGWFDRGGKPIPMPLPDGLSGSALWQTARSGSSREKWSPTLSRIVGVIHRWDMKSESLIATRIEVVRDFLLDAVRHEAAYFKWLARGAPSQDDWQDWFEVVRTIGGLSS
jgi:hypothetical protein